MKSFPLLLTLALLPASALAEQQCKFNQPQALELDLAGAKAVVFEVNSHELRLQHLHLDVLHGRLLWYGPRVLSLETAAPPASPAGGPVRNILRHCISIIDGFGLFTGFHLLRPHLCQPLPGAHRQ